MSFNHLRLLGCIALVTLVAGIVQFKPRRPLSQSRVLLWSCLFVRVV